MKETEKNDVLLQKAVDQTNRYALRMDQTNAQLQSIQKPDLAQKEKNEILSEKEKLILDLDLKNQEWEQNIEKIKNQLGQTIITTETLMSELDKEKQLLKKASPVEKIKLSKKIDEKEKLIQVIEKQQVNLTKSMKSQGTKLAKSYAAEEDLIQEIKQLQLDSPHLEKSFFGRLQREREEQEQKFKSILQASNTLVNQLLDQQEKDQKKAWYQKINFKILPTVSIDQKNQNKKDLEKEYYFFAPLADHPVFSKIKERYSEKTKKWEIVEPKKTLN